MLDTQIIKENSPLRRVPTALNHRQRLFIEAVRYSIEMADLAFTRLCNMFLLMGESGALPEGIGFAHVFLDAWSVVDTVHRLRTLVEQFPGLKNPLREPFLRATAGVKELRNAVQHLIGEFGNDSGADDLPWGRLCWVCGPFSGDVLKVRLMVAGSVTSTIHPLVNPLGRDIELPIGLVHLDAHGHTLSLSEVMHAVMDIAGVLERAWEAAIANRPDRMPVDVIITIDLSPADGSLVKGCSS